MKKIYPDNDYDFIWGATAPNAVTGEEEPVSGLAGLSAHISATKGGDPIHAELSRQLIERAGKPGEYFGVVDGDDLRTYLVPDYLGTIVYEVVGDGVNVLYSAPLQVLETRIP